jgi:hypothetical protein
MALVTCPDCGRHVSDVAPACPNCGRPTGFTAVVAPAVSRSQLPPLFWIGGIAFLVAALGVLLVISNKPAPMKGTPIAASAAPSAAATEEHAATPEPTADMAALLAPIDHGSAKYAFDALRPQMGDTANDDSKGADLFALWAARRMTWSDVYVAQDETTFAAVQKDSDDQLGKRMCSAGSIIEIHAMKPASGGHVAIGIFLSDAQHLYRFLVGGSSGNLGQNSYSTLCGFVTGNYDYSNSGGGTGHAVSIVGMFDLPENRKPGR